jgi:hypothetical protein
VRHPDGSDSVFANVDASALARLPLDAFLNQLVDASRGWSSSCRSHFMIATFSVPDVYLADLMELASFGEVPAEAGRRYEN